MSVSQQPAHHGRAERARSAGHQNGALTLVTLLPFESSLVMTVAVLSAARAVDAAATST